MQSEHEFLKGFTRIPNSGQHNDGIFIKDDELIKCTRFDARKINNSVNEINSGEAIFPIIYDTYYDELSEKTFTKMLKLDGDITSLFYEYIPNEVLNEMGLLSLKEDIMKIFNAKVPKTMGKNLIKYAYYKANSLDVGQFTEIRDYFKEVNKNVSYEIYDTFMKKVLENIRNYYLKITTTMVKLQLQLLEKGYRYIDKKFDNYGYMFVNSRVDLSMPFYDTYIRFYILDWESGLFPLSHNDSPLDDITRDIKGCFKYYGTNGQYNIRNFNATMVNTQCIQNNIEEQAKIKAFLNLPDELYKIVMSDYTFDVSNI